MSTKLLKKLKQYQDKADDLKEEIKELLNDMNKNSKVIFEKNIKLKFLALKMKKTFKKIEETPQETYYIDY